MLLKLGALRFQPRWQHQMQAKFGGLLVNAEPRRIRRDLKQNVTRFAKVDRAKILAIPHIGDVHPRAAQFGLPRELAGIVAGPPRDMMDSAHRDMTQRGLWIVNDVENGARSTRADCVACAVASFAQPTEA